MSGGIDWESELRLANALLKRCIECHTIDSEVEKALRSPGAITAIAKMRTVPNVDQDVLCMNLFRLGAVVALSIRDAEAIK